MLKFMDFLNEQAKDVKKSSMRERIELTFIFLFNLIIVQSQVLSNKNGGWNHVVDFALDTYWWTNTKTVFFGFVLTLEWKYKMQYKSQPFLYHSVSEAPEFQHRVERFAITKGKTSLQMQSKTKGQ